jgi:hypothetical protein
LCSRQQFLRPRPHLEILGELAPAHDAAAVDEELRWTGDVISCVAGALVQDAVAADDGRVPVGEERVGVADLAAPVARDLGSVDADSDRLDAGGTEFRKVLFDTP